MKNLDCKGLACPGPVIQVKKALEEIPQGGSFSVELDSEASRDNVRRFAESRGAAVRIEEGDEGAIRLIITAPGEERIQESGSMKTKPPAIFISAQTIGKGDEKLGRILMEGFINTLPDQERIPDRIILMNAGVKLAVEGSVVLENLKKLTDSGCEIMVCGTCLDFFGVMDKLAVGSVSNMYDIQGAMLEAGSLISP